MPYILTDCSNPDNVLCVSLNLADHVGSVITLRDDTGHELPTCWLVSETQTECIESTFIEIYKCYDTCEDCLPKRVPMVVRPRAVYPGYDTGNCDPELVEKAFCNHADMMYHQMMEKRYAIKNCCPQDEIAVTNKMFLMELNLMKSKSPNVDLCNPICYRYMFPLNVGDSAVITYSDCDGTLQEVITGIYTTAETYSFCAQNTTSPIVVITKADTTVETHYLEPIEECN